MSLLFTIAYIIQIEYDQRLEFLKIGKIELYTTIRKTIPSDYTLTNNYTDATWFLNKNMILDVIPKFIKLQPAIITYDLSKQTKHATDKIISEEQLFYLRLKTI